MNILFKRLQGKENKSNSAGFADNYIMCMGEHDTNLMATPLPTDGDKFIYAYRFGSMKVKFKKLKDNAMMPTRGSKNAAGYDLYSTNTEFVSIDPGETVCFDIGIAVELPDGYFGGICARSGLATKKGLRPANCFAVIDSDYRGELKVFLHNDSQKIQSISPNERIAQLLLLPYVPMEFEEVEDLNSTKRGKGGFGSTGTN